MINRDKPAVALAKWFLARGACDGQVLTVMHLQKLLYLADLWHTRLFSQSLIDEPLTEFKWGPAYASVYRRFVKYGSKAITRLNLQQAAEVDQNTRRLLERIWEVFGTKSVIELTACALHEAKAKAAAKK